MQYHFSKSVSMNFDDAVASTKEALTRHNFRVLTEIDMKDNFKTGLGIDFRPYVILGACNPQLTYRALQAEDKIGDVTLQHRSAAARRRSCRGFRSRPRCFHAGHHPRRRGSSCPRDALSFAECGR